MVISVMWMTRNRSHELTYSLASFINNADDNANVEYIFTLDPDDKETLLGLRKIEPMAHANKARFKIIVMDKRYGYAELEQYQNKAGEEFTGECLFILNDDLMCMSRGWDTELRKCLESAKDSPSWIGVIPENESWKNTPTFVGINRKWLEVVGRVSGTRATDGYLKIVGRESGIKPLTFTANFVHLQRGRYLPDDGAGGYPTKNRIPPKYEFEHGIGKQRIEEDVAKLKKWKEAR